MKTDKPNLAIELLKRLLDGEIRSFENKLYKRIFY